MDVRNVIKNQEKIYNMLKNTIKEDRLSHAYLFYGEEGTGKKEMAYALSCLLYGDDDSFHVYSELLGKEYPIDLNISYFDLLNFIFNGRDPQMLITVRLCADKMPYVSEVRCHCKYETRNKLC